MQNLKSRRSYLSISSATMTLALLLCCIPTASVKAQKTPPILGDKESSAFGQDISQLQTAAAANTEAGRLARNRLIAIGVEQIDTVFHDYRKQSRKRSNLLSFLFDFLEIGASSAISIVNGERAKSLIGEGLSLFQGSRSAFNKDFRFLERQILFDKMVAKRSQKLTSIYERLNEDTATFPWEQARGELREYFFAGTMDEALSALSRETGAEATAAVAELKTVTPGQFEASKTYTQLVADLFKAARDASKPEAAGAALKKLKGAMKSNLDLTPAGTTAAAIDAMSIAQVEALYRSAGVILFDHPDKVTALVEALK
ncbi:MAG TPA: hypothetical protein VIW64_19490 [Pyrinomonadaceae bacterium]|jgi:hypothetical protein